MIPGSKLRRKNKAYLHRLNYLASRVTELVGNLRRTRQRIEALEEALDDSTDCLKYVVEDSAAYNDLKEQIADNEKLLGHEERPMTGFLATMTPEQLQQAKDYDGPINVGMHLPANPYDPTRYYPEVTDAMVEAACKAWWPSHWPKQFDPKDAMFIRESMRKALAAALKER